MRGLYLVTPNWADTGHLLAATEAGLRGGAAQAYCHAALAESFAIAPGQRIPRRYLLSTLLPTLPPTS